MKGTVKMSSGHETVLSYCIPSQIENPIINPINALKHYHQHKCDQARTLAESIRTDILQNLKEMIKTQTIDTKKIIVDTRRYDLLMQSILDKLDKVNIINYLNSLIFRPNLNS